VRLHHDPLIPGVAPPNDPRREDDRGH
jgi:hypothetical protein